MAYIGHNKLKGIKLSEYWLKPENIVAGPKGEGWNGQLHCYLMNAKGAKTLLDAMCPIKHQLCTDVWMRQNFDKFTAYFYIPHWIEQIDGGKSDRRPAVCDSQTAAAAKWKPRKGLQWNVHGVLTGWCKDKFFWEMYHSPLLFEGYEDLLTEMRRYDEVWCFGHGPIYDRPQDLRDAYVIQCNNWQHKADVMAPGEVDAFLKEWAK